MKHSGRYIDGRTSHPEWKVYRAMLTRCYNPNSSEWKRYGKRGIKVCDRWREDYANFISDMGRRPNDDCQLDRINNDGDYAPDNCRWISAKENSRNKRDNVVLEYKGKKHTIIEWSELLGIKPKTLYTRHDRGYCVGDILYKGNLQERNNKRKGYRPFRQSN